MSAVFGGLVGKAIAIKCRKLPAREREREWYLVNVQIKMGTVG